jgi:limonene-1,2-epoxide hydrolase
MSPREIVKMWVDAFNSADLKRLIDFYAEHAVNHQVANEPVVGRHAIQRMFEEEFGKAKMVCIPENIFEDQNWGILEWCDPQGLRGCGFFQFEGEKIILQRGYWDKLSFHRLHQIPVEA